MNAPATRLLRRAAARVASRGGASSAATGVRASSRRTMMRRLDLGAATRQLDLGAPKNYGGIVASRMGCEPAVVRGGGRRWFGASSCSDREEEEEEEEVMAEVREANERCLGQLHVQRAKPHQWGVFASRPFRKGSIVISSKPLQSAPDPSPDSCSHSIQTGWNEHIIMELPARFLNHSCDPNVGVGRVNEWGSYDFVALRNIGAGEEVRFDYETTEYEVGAFAECHCGAEDCRGVVRGYRHSADAVRAKYEKGHIAEYLTNKR